MEKHFSAASIGGLHLPARPKAGDPELPPADTARWVTTRKAQVVTGVRRGLISLEEACRRYKLSIEEFLSWERLVDRHGVDGLRTTRLQDYREGGRKG